MGKENLFSFSKNLLCCDSMGFKFCGRDFGVFALGREVLKEYPASEIEFLISEKEEKGLSEQDLWQTALSRIAKEKTRFGRIGIFYDHFHQNILDSNLSLRDLAYSPSSVRAEKLLKISFFPTQILHHMAKEGWADTVEFRRIARKFLKKAKHAHCDVVFWAESIFGEEKTKQILQHLAGTQMKVFVCGDFLFSHLEFDSKSSERKERKITIKTSENTEFTQKRAEKILRTKLKKEDVISS